MNNRASEEGKVPLPKFKLAWEFWLVEFGFG